MAPVQNQVICLILADHQVRRAVVQFVAVYVVDNCKRRERFAHNPFGDQYVFAHVPATCHTHAHVPFLQVAPALPIVVLRA
jgi:hypothetical protein